jgi:tRNA(Ile)-lysidine synthase TilS/MesJ
MRSEISYSRWREEHQNILKEFPGKNVKLLFSGGNDSSLALDFILRAGKEFEFDFETHAGAYPVHVYTDVEKDRITSYWNKRGVDIIWHELGVTDEIKDAVNPCLVCLKLKRSALKSNFLKTIDDWKNLVVIVNYSLWDLASYCVEYVLMEISSTPDQDAGVQKSGRILETAQRFYPLLKMKEGYTVFQPLIKYNTSEILELITEKGIPTLSIPCKFRDFRPKRIFEKYYEKMGIRFDYEQVFQYARESLNLPDISSYLSLSKEEYLLNIL